MSEERSALDAYMASVRRLPRHTREQLEELHTLARAGGADSLRARELLWQEALRLVIFAASKLTASRAMPPDLDMIQEGNIAAGRAVDTWNPSQGRFSTWIVRAAHGAMLDHYKREQRKGTGSKDAPLPYMIALDASAGQLDEEAATDLPGTADGDTSPMYDALELGWLESPECAAERANMRRLVGTIRDNDVRSTLTAYFGLDGDAPRTLEQIAGSCGLSVGFVHKTLHKGYKLLREKLS